MKNPITLFFLGLTLIFIGHILRWQSFILEAEQKYPTKITLVKLQESNALDAKLKKRTESCYFEVMIKDSVREDIYVSQEMMQDLGYVKTVSALHTITCPDEKQNEYLKSLEVNKPSVGLLLLMSFLVLALLVAFILLIILIKDSIQDLIKLKQENK